MAKKEVTIVLKAIDEASKVLEHAAKNTLPAFAKSLAQVAAGFVSVGAVEELLRGSINAYIESEKVATRLAGALRAQGLATGELVPKLLEQARALSLVSMASDEAITSAQQVLISVGGLLGPKLTEATKAALDLSAGLGIDLSEAAMRIAKAAEGSVREFTRLGVTFKADASDAEKLDTVLAFVQKRFGGMAANELTTVAGATTQATKAFHELEETLGKVLLTAAGGASGIRGVTSALEAMNVQANNPKAQGFWTSLAIAFAGAAATGASQAAGPWALAIKQITDNADAATASVGKLDDALSPADAAQHAWLKMDADWAAAIAKNAEDATAQAKKLQAILDDIDTKTIAPQVAGPKASVTGASSDDVLQRMVEAAEAQLRMNDATQAQLDALNALSDPVHNIAEAWERIASVQQAISDATPEQQKSLMAMAEALLANAAAAEKMTANMQLGMDIAKQAATQLGAVMVRAAFDSKTNWGQALKQIAEGIAQAIVQALILKALQSAFGFGFSAGGVVGSGAPSPISWYASGGLVPSYASGGMFAARGTDTVPAMLTPGETVLPRGVTQSILGGRMAVVGAGAVGGSTYNVYALDRESFRSALRRNAAAVVEVQDYIRARGL